jgi:hypothetical protein
MLTARCGGLSIIEVATVLRGAQPFNTGNVNATYVGQILLQDGAIRQAIIKDLDARELANELMAAAIALTVGLPMPTPYVAASPVGSLPSNKGPIIQGRQLTFATVDANTPSLRQLVLYRGIPNFPALISELLNWPGIGLLYAFDSFVANIDRNLGNVLFGGASRVLAIDHGHCFTGPQWAPADLQPDTIFVSKLKDWLTPQIPLPARPGKAAAAAVMTARLDNQNLEELGHQSGVGEILGPADFQALIRFLEARKIHVPRIAADRHQLHRVKQLIHKELPPFSPNPIGAVIECFVSCE